MSSRWVYEPPTKKIPILSADIRNGVNDYPGFFAVTFQELESIMMPFGFWNGAKAALSALAISP